jgi:hypothetical protein
MESEPLWEFHTKQKWQGWDSPNAKNVSEKTSTFSHNPSQRRRLCLLLVVSLFVCLPVCLFACLPVCLFACLVPCKKWCKCVPLTVVALFLKLNAGTKFDVNQNGKSWLIGTNLRFTLLCMYLVRVQRYFVKIQIVDIKMWNQLLLYPNLTYLVIT